MRNALATALVVILIPVLGAAGTPPPAAPAKTQAPLDTATLAQATTVVDAFHAALKKGDKAAALSLLDDSIEIYEQGAVEHNKAEYAAKHLDADIAFSAATKRNRTSKGGAMLGNLAYITSENKVTGTFKGKAVAMVSIETMVLHKSAKGWKILHIHWSSREGS